MRAVRGRGFDRRGIEVVCSSGVVRKSLACGGRRTSRGFSGISGRRGSSFGCQENIEPSQIPAGGVVDSVPGQSELTELRYRVMELERENSILKNKYESLVDTLNEYKIANKNLVKRPREENISGTAVLRDYRGVECELSAQTTEKKMLREVTKEMIARAVKDKRVHSKKTDKILVSVNRSLLVLRCKF